MAAAKSKEDLIERYVYAVTSKLPTGQREEIAQDVRGLIGDMLEERAQGNEADMAAVEEVLTELGQPDKLAAQYREKKRYLIGPALFDTYWVVLKIVLFWALVGLAIAYCIRMIVEPSNAIKLIAEYIGVSLFSVVVQVFAWVTVIFAIMEHFGVKADDIARKKKGPWHPSELPAVPNDGTRIRISETVVSMMFVMLFFVLFVYSNNMLGIHLHVGSSAYTFIPIWDYEVVHQWLPFFYGLLALYILREIIKLIFGQWTMKLAIYTLAINAIIFILYIIMFADQSIWNPSFMSEMLASGIVTQNMASSTDSYTIVSRIWEISKDTVLPIIAIVLILENATNFYRAAKNRVTTVKRAAG